jgi:hypothetical protein
MQIHSGNIFYNENSILNIYCRIRILKDLIEAKMYSFLKVYLISGDTNLAAILFLQLCMDIRALVKTNVEIK